MCHKHHSQQWSLIGSHRRGNVQENRAEVGWVDRTTQACELKKSCTSAGFVPLIGPRIVDTRRAADGGGRTIGCGSSQLCSPWEPHMR